MEIHVRRSVGTRNDLLLILPRSEIEGVLLHIAHRDDLMRQPGLTRHRENTPDERKRNRQCKIALEEHLTAMGVRDTEGRVARPVIAIGSRNLGNNHGSIAWQRDRTPNLFHVQGDPLDYDGYSCLVTHRGGRLSIQDLRFDPGTGRVRRTDGGADVTEEIEWATFGQQVLRAGRTVSIEEIIDRFYDIRHVLAYDTNRPEGRAIAEAIYRDYPSRFQENALRAWQEQGVPRARYLHNAIGLSVESVILLQREGTIEEIALWLQEAGAEDGLILDNGGSVACWASWLYSNGGFLFAAPDYRPPASSIVAFVLKGPLRTDLPGGSVSYALV